MNALGYALTWALLIGWALLLALAIRFMARAMVRQIRLAAADVRRAAEGADRPEPGITGNGRIPEGILVMDDPLLKMIRGSHTTAAPALPSSDGDILTEPQASDDKNLNLED
jgi:hypothetical protein